MLKRCLLVALLLVGSWGCKDSFRVGTNRPDGVPLAGQVGNPDAGHFGGSDGSLATGGASGTTGASGGTSGTGGAGGVARPDAEGPVKDASGPPPDAPAPEPDSSAADGSRSSADVPDRSVCFLPKDVGNCDGVCNAYWYNQATGHCELFTWGCCGGNANNFATLGACTSTCAPDSATDAAAADGRATSDGPGEAGSATGSGLGMSCTTDLDCPADSRCCNGSDPSCDGTLLPSGDRPNAGEFVVSADGLAVTDTITGLVWQRDGSGARAGCSGEGNLRCTWNEAQAYCAALKLGGFEGWRLPGWNELINITDLTNDGSTPPLDQSAFPGTPMEGFWTSSRRSNASCTGEMYVNFTNVTLGTCAAQELRVRCVRGSRCYPKSRFVVLDTEKDVDGAEVRDTLTGLVWQQLVKSPLPECANWTDAQIYCASLGQGFRLPTFKEELSLFGPDMRVDRTIFSPTRCDYTWTSTPYGGADATLTGLARCPRESSLDTGQNWFRIGLRYGVRCVR
jgi:hypothetical protein